MRNQKIWLGILLLAIIVFGGTWYQRNHREVERLYLNAVPVEVETTENARISFRKPFLDDPCGIAIFTLSERTRERIAKEGIQFFKSVVTPRGYPFNQYDFSAWQPTPAPNLMGDSILYGMSCASFTMAPNESDLVKALHSPGSYVSKGTNKALLVIPELGIVVYGFESS